MNIIKTNLSLYRKWFLVIGIILMFFSITLVFHSTGKFIWLGGWDIIPIQNGVIHQSCQTIKGNCYYVDVNAIFDKKSISSPYSQMHEDGKSIGPANSKISNIVSKGAGRFLFLHNGDLYFSASDNSSPFLNNRRYELVTPRLIISQRVVSFVWVFTAAMLLLYIASLVKDYYERYKTSKKSTKSFLPTQKVLVCMFLSVSISVSCAIHFLNFWQFGLATKILILFALCELLSIVIYNILFHFILPHIANFSQRARWKWIISSFVIAVFLMTVIPVQIPYPNDADLPTYIYQNDMNSVSFELIPIILGKIQVSSLLIDVSLNLFILLSISLILLGIDIITLSVLTFIFVITLSSFHIKKSSPTIPESNWSIIGYALPMIVVWSFFLFTFYPAIMSGDSINQWKQVVTERFNDDHPIFHTLNIWLFSRLWFSPSSMIVAQLIALALVIGWGLQYFRRIGSPFWIVWSISIMSALSPINGMMIVSLWKDLPYSISIIGLLFILLKIIFTKGKWLSGFWSPIILGIVLALISLYRHEGIIISIPILLCLLACYFSYLRRLSISVLFFILTLVSIKGFLYNNINVVRSSISDQVLIIKQLHMIGAHISAGNQASQEEMILINRIRPFDIDWKEYNCNTVKTVYRENDFDWKFAYSNIDKINQLFWKFVMTDPYVDIKHILCFTSAIWRIAPLEDSRFYIYNFPFLPENVLSRVEAKSILTNLQYPLSKYTMVFSDYLDIFGRPSFLTYWILIATCICSIKTKNIKYMLLALPAVLQDSAWAIAGITYQFRYFYSIFLTGWIIAPLLVIGFPEVRKHN